MKVNILSQLNNEAIEKARKAIKNIADKPVRETKNYSKNRIDFNWNDPKYISYDKKLSVLRFGNEEHLIKGKNQVPHLEMFFYRNGFPKRKVYSLGEIIENQTSFTKKITKNEKTLVENTFREINFKLIGERTSNGVFVFSKNRYYINPLFIPSSSLRDL